MKALLLSAILFLGGVSAGYGQEVIPEVMLPVRGLCNTLEGSRSIMRLVNGPPAQIKFRQLIFEGECFTRLIPVASVCLVEESTYPARPGRVFRTYRFTDPAGVQRYGATLVPSRLNSAADAVSTGMCGGEDT